MPNNQEATKFTDIWTQFEARFNENELRPTTNLGATMQMLDDSAGRYTPALLSASSVSKIKGLSTIAKGVIGAGGTPTATVVDRTVKIPFINRETVDTSTAGDICAIGAANNRVTGKFQYRPDFTINIPLSIEPLEYERDAIGQMEALSSTMTRAIDNINTRLETANVALLEADKNVYWTGLQLPDGWAVVGNALQISATVQDRFYNDLKSVVQQSGYGGMYQVTCTPNHAADYRVWAAQGSANSTNLATTLYPSEFDVQESFAIVNPDVINIKDVLYVRPAGNTMIIDRTPNKFMLPEQYRKNVDGKFDLDFEVTPFAALPYSFGTKTQLLCNADDYENDEINPADAVTGFGGLTELQKNWMTELIRFTAPLSDPANMIAPIWRIEFMR